MRRLLLTILFLLLAISSYAQGVNVTASWTQPNALADAQAFTYTLKIDTNNPVALTTTCVQTNTTVTCTAPLTNWILNVSHTVVITVSDINGNTASATFPVSAAPSAPTGLKITKS